MLLLRNLNMSKELIGLFSSALFFYCLLLTNDLFQFLNTVLNINMSIM